MLAAAGAPWSVQALMGRCCWVEAAAGGRGGLVCLECAGAAG